MCRAPGLQPQRTIVALASRQPRVGVIFFFLELRITSAFDARRDQASAYALDEQRRFAGIAPGLAEERIATAVARNDNASAIEAARNALAVGDARRARRQLKSAVASYTQAVTHANGA